MIKSKEDSAQSPDPHCLDKREMPGVFLRLHSQREQIALPYSCLLKLTLSLDETVLELSFVTHRVTISGKRLLIIYAAIAEAEARTISVVAPDYYDKERISSIHALVSGLRIEPLEENARNKR
jgi:hypothetical protein